MEPNEISRPSQTSGLRHSQTSHSRFKERLKRPKTNYPPPVDIWPRTDSEDDVFPQPFRLGNLTFNEDAIRDALNSHRRFKVKEGYEMKNLPKFDDLTRYDVSEARELELWAFELGRIAEAVRSTTPPRLEGRPEWFGLANEDGYNRLHIIALAIECGLDICTHDNELVMIEHHPRQFRKPSFEKAQKRLLRNFDPEEGTVRWDRNMKLDEHHDEVYHALVNYSTATLARLLVRTVKGDFWVDNCLTSLAKIAAKLKVVAVDLPQAVVRTMEARREFMLRIHRSSRFSFPAHSSADSWDEKGVDHDKESYLARQQMALRDTEDSSGERYFVILGTFRRNIRQLLTSAFADLTWDEEISQTADVFEKTAVIYNTGFKGLRTLFCQERDGAIGAGVERRLIRCATVAFSVCHEAWERLPSAGPSAFPGHLTELDWNYTEMDEGGDLRQSHPQHKSFSSMAQVITALVPYAMCFGHFANQLSIFAREASSISDPSDPVRYFMPPNFLAAARMRTSQYARKRDMSTTGVARRFANVYDTQMAQMLALAGMPAVVDSDNEQERSRKAEVGEKLRKKYDETIKKLQEADKCLEEWDIDERSIIVTDMQYTLTVLLGFFVLTAGALALVALQDRVSGVDPSNLTLLIWTAAGVLMIYFKSRRVENWPWRDFLRGRVVCRSLSELRAVSGIDEQMLLAVLMRNETRMFLAKRGPFNLLFANKSDDGFAIDVPTRAATAIAGGVVFVRVNGRAGPALVALEVKRWESYTCIAPQDMMRRGDGFVCRDLDPGHYRLPLGKSWTSLDEAGGGGKPKPPPEAVRAEGNNGKQGSPLYPICNNELKWYRVRGVFVEDALFN